MFVFVRILLVLFLVINAGIIAMCTILHFDMVTTAKTITLLYQRAFYKSSIIAKRSLIHPLLFVKWVLGKATCLIVLAITLILHPNIVLTFYAFSIYMSLAFLITSWFPITLGIKILMLFIAFVFYAVKSDVFLIPLKPVVIFVWANIHRIGKFFFNASLNAYEDMMEIKHSQKIKPSDYFQNKVDDYNKMLEDSINEKNTKENVSESSSSLKRQNSSFNLKLKNELEILGLYDQDFTIDDLKKRRKMLLKINHPDNFQKPEDISFHQEKSNKISAAYKTVMSELEKSATVN